MIFDPLPAATGLGAVDRSVPAALSPSQPLLAAVVLATALAYTVAALLSLFFSANGPGWGYDSPVWAWNPAAGVALAAALSFGRAAVVGVALGSFMVQLGLAVWQSPDAAHIDTVLPALWALGAALQAAVGAALLGRFLPQPLLLQKWADIVRAGLYGALLACAVGASVATAVLLAWAPLGAAGSTPWANNWPSFWLSSWLANSLGALIVTPIVLTCIGRPRKLWKARQCSLALPLLAALALLGATTALLQHSEEQRAVADFERSAAGLAGQLEARLDTATHALQAVHGALRAWPGERLPDSETLWQAAQWWWKQPVGLRTVALALRESSAADKTGGEEAAEPASERTTLRLRVPAPAPAETLPSDWLAQAPRAAQAGLQRARREGEVVALTEALPGMDHRSAGQVTLVQALYRGRAANEAARQALFSAYLLVSFDLQQTFVDFKESPANALRWCLYDSAPGAAPGVSASAEHAGDNTALPRLLAGVVTCNAASLANTAASDRHWQQRLRLADRELHLQISQPRVDAGGTLFGNAPSAIGTVLQMGLWGVAALGGMLLSLTRRSAHAEPADLARPAASAEPGPASAERIASRAAPLQLEALALQPFLQDCLRHVQAGANDRAVHLSQPTPGEAPQALTVRADRSRLTQVLTHLLSNAIAYNHEDGVVVVHAEVVDPGIVELCVADTGRGMHPEQLAGLFQADGDLGHNGDEATNDGTGLGTSRRLVEMMGGTLEVQSQPGVGSTFKLRLPGWVSLQAAPTQSAPTQTPRPPHTLRVVHYVQGPPRAEDPVCSALEQHPQIELSTSVLGLDGLGAIRRLRPDLVLLSAQLPDINGLELLRHLKRDPALANTPVIMVAGSAETKERAVALGALHCVINPNDPEQFLAWVDNELSAQDRAQSSQRDHRRSLSPV